MKMFLKKHDDLARLIRDGETLAALELLGELNSYLPKGKWTGSV